MNVTCLSKGKCLIIVQTEKGNQRVIRHQNRDHCGVHISANDNIPVIIITSENYMPGTTLSNPNGLYQLISTII